jgi:NDP-sugar pyrophosphorylase family protein
MKAGIIAAGHGERLHAAGITTPKPLLAIGGRPLIARAIETARLAGATEIACIVNAETDQVRHFLEHGDFGMPVHIVQRTTASSADSLLALRPHLDAAPFLLLTVDAVLAPSGVAAMVRHAAALPAGASVLGVTTVVDDEKPLWAEVDDDGRIRTLGDATRARHVTAGVYFLQPVMYALADAMPPDQRSALRALLAALLRHGHALYGVDVGATVDVDRPEDIVSAERLLGLIETV